MPYTGKEGEKGERAVPICPLCKAKLTYMPENQGYHCVKCDEAGKTGCYMRGKTVVGRF